MTNSLIWIGAGDLAQRIIPYLDNKQWQNTAINRSGQATNFQYNRTADVTNTTSLHGLPAASQKLKMSFLP